MDKQLKETLVNKVRNSLDNSSDNERILIKDFSTITYKKPGKYLIFHHPSYKNKRLDYFNEEEDTDFLIFETNSIYIDYSDNLFTFHKIKDEEKLMILDLNNQEVKNSETSGLENLDLSEEILVDIDMITLNYFPISLSHSYLTICHEQNFAQVLSNEIILKMLQLFTMTDNTSLRIGYNSLGAGCIINHLHFEILFLDDFQNINSLPIEQNKSEIICSTFLKYINEEEISIFDENISITISSVDYPIRCWKIQAFEHQEESALTNSFQSSISHCANLISTRLIDAEIPHNLVISDKGRTIYIIPRNFDDQKFKINTCWNDLAGLVTVKESKDYQDLVLDEEKINDIFRENLSLSEEEFNSFTQAVLKLMGSIYFLDKPNNA